MSDDKIQRSRWTPDTDLPVNEFILEAQTHFRSSKEEERTGIVILEPQIALNDSIIGFDSNKEVLIYSVAKLIQCYETKSNLSKDEAWDWFMYSNYTVSYPNYPEFTDFPSDSKVYMDNYFEKLKEAESEKSK